MLVGEGEGDKGLCLQGLWRVLINDIHSSLSAVTAMNNGKSAKPTSVVSKTEL